MTTPLQQGTSRRRWLALADMLALAATTILSVALARVADAASAWDALVLLVAFGTLLMVQMAVHDGYRTRHRFRPVADAVRVLHGAFTAAAIVVLGGVAAGLPALGPQVGVRLHLLVGMLAPTVLLVMLRLFGRRLQRRAFTRGARADTVVLVGTEAAVRRVRTAIDQRPHLGIEVATAVCARDGGTAQGPDEVREFADAIDAALASREVNQLVLAFDRELPRLRAVSVREAASRGLRLGVAPGSFEHCYGGPWPTGSVPLLALDERASRGIALALKHGTDRVLALALLVILAPVLALIALTIRLQDGEPAIFRQRRVGERGREFRIVKFRTMSVDAEQRRSELLADNEASGPLFKMRRDPRVTRVGRWLRRTSLDELPQLWNVVTGEMSLVGPRPPIPDEVDAYDPRHRRRLLVRPGITGLWQVSGRSDTSFERMVGMDVDYIDRWSLALDARLLLRTIPVVLRRQGAY